MKLNTVGIALSYYREKYGLSMTQVCEGICSPATMFRIEEGYREVDSLVSATLLSRIGKQVLEFELLLNEKDYNLFRLRKDIHRNLEEKNLDTAEKLLQSYQSVMPKKQVLHEQYYLWGKAELLQKRGASKEEIKAELTKIFNEKTEQHALTKHYEKGLTCVTCHDQQRVGGPDWMTSVTAPEMKKNCGDCHETQKAVFAKTDTHQKITCVACHMPNIPSPEDFTGPDAVEQYYSAVRRSHLYRINTDPTAQTLIRSDAKEGSGERLWTYALDKKGHAYVDIVWSCGRATPGDYTLSGDAQGCHSPATSTLDEGLRYGSQQAIYDEIQKWQEPVKAKFAEIEKGLERIKQLLEVTKLTPEELAEVHLMLDKAQEIYDQVKKDGSWGVHAPRYLLDRVTSGAAYIVRAQAIVDNGGYQPPADKRAAEKKAAK